MNLRTIVLGLIATALLSSCVTRRLYNDLEEQYQEALKENDNLSNDLAMLNSSNSDLEKGKKELAKQLKELQEERKNLNAEIIAAENRLKDLEQSYKTLQKNNRDALEAEAARLSSAKSELASKSTRIAELEAILAANDKQMRDLKESLSSALNAFEGKGLSIEQKNGRVYVSMENKLLFRSGSWSVNQEGAQAVNELSKVLANNPHITVLIEGHTDNDKIVGQLGEGVKTNWDLSTKRALAIVEIITSNPDIVKSNITAAGRSEYAPLQSNDTPEGKAKNRRIEVILTPNLDKINSMLNAL
ncbi:OmpA family protein [Myroides albus]|uniref:OmpA family protein n=1 Tax=Myroides albus TaxID=2562892 RepID=A0A6I3LI63_9FLAO|nr:OmpA family protein [Myroides albus]MTG97943.1 OmpA family protein [Myroides albus]UVD81131.1 OmpA family protein [Myroides albus]